MPALNAAVMGDQNELDHSSTTQYRPKQITVAVKGIKEIALVSTGKADSNRTCASVVWSEPRFVTRFGDGCR
jgi:hypothetical protein